MKKYTLITTMLLTTIVVLGQYTKIDTSFYSEALQETKMVDIYLPPGYDENPDWHYPVIYYLHGWTENQNSMHYQMLYWTNTLINNGTIEPVIMVGADNSPEPFEGSMYVNSSLWGNYEDYMINDLISWIDASFRTIPDKNGRALLGQSMGAFGAFWYGIVHKDKFRALAAHAGVVGFNKEIWLDDIRQLIINENQPGPPYFYDYNTDGTITRAAFLLSGAFSPNANTPQTYINPPVVDYLFDENGDYIDTIYSKWLPFDLSEQVKQLTVADSVGIYFGCGTADDFLLYPLQEAMQDTLDAIGLPYEFYSHSGNHSMPPGFKQGALIFIDSLLVSPGIYTSVKKYESKVEMIISPNPTKDYVNFSFNSSKSYPAKISIYSVSGTCLMNQKNFNTKEEITLDLTNYPSGIYLCRLMMGNEIVTRKIIKQ